MKAHYVNIAIDKNAHMKLPVSCMAHEVPIYVAVHGEGRVELVGDAKDYIDLEDLDAEFQRLEQKFGTDPTGASWAQNVYGRLFEGRLESAIKKGLGLVGLKSAGGKRAAQKPEEPTDPLS